MPPSGRRSMAIAGSTGTPTAAMAGKRPVSAWPKHSRSRCLRDHDGPDLKPGRGEARRGMTIRWMGIVVAAAAVFTAGSAWAEGGDPEAGKVVFKKCAICHSPDAGVNKVGPSLHGIVGRH